MAKLDEDFRLNTEQKKAIRHLKGPLLVIAGAGTGKTTVITERIKYLVLSKEAKPEEILALTFTQKGAQEMEERVDIAMPYGYTDMWISTFHNFCDRVLKEESLQIGLDPKYNLLGVADSIKLIRDNLFKFKFDYFLSLGNPDKFIEAILQHFSRLQDEDITPSDYTKWVVSFSKKKKTFNKEDKLELKKWQELSQAFKTYEELKVRNRVLDFGDLITKTLKLFRDRPNVLKEYQKRFKYILVDEYQDTNIAQNKLIELLAGKNGNVTVVADDDQAIYRFRGAAVSNIIQFRKSFPKAKAVSLIKNYRSGEMVLDSAYKLIEFNNPDRLEVLEKINKKLISQKKDKGEVDFLHFERVENEAEGVVAKAKELVDSGFCDFKDIAILVRANNHAEPFVRAFGRKGIPFQFLGPGRLFNRPEVLDMISYLKVLDDFNDSVSLYRLLSISFFEIDAKDLVSLGNFAKRKNISLFAACERVSELPLKRKTKTTIKKILKVINDHFKLVKKETAGQLLYYFLEETNLLVKLLNPKNFEAEKIAKNISKFFDKLKTYEVDHKEATVEAVVTWIELAMEVGESPLAADLDWTDINAVNILTVHSAKGLEFPVVFLVNLVSQRFPTVKRKESIPIPNELIKEILPIGDFHTQEERRLFYVGMTRAESKLFLTAADYYGEGKRQKKISPFVFESMGDIKEIPGFEKKENKQLSFLEFKGKEKNLDEKKPPIKIDYLSYSQIQTFSICPLHYKLRYILKIPTPPSPAQSFGISIHAALNDFFVAAQKGKRVTTKTLLNFFSQNWINEGYLDKAHEKASFKKGKKLLTTFYERDFERKNLPITLEQVFRIPIKAERPLMVGGKIDVVKKSQKGIEIVDYKTGNRVPSQKDADRDLQLTIYALAASSIKSSPFDKSPDKVSLTLHFLESGEKITTTRTKKDLDEAVEKILEVREKIEKSDFSCSGHAFCGKCEFKLMCQSD